MCSRLTQYSSVAPPPRLYWYQEVPPSYTCILLKSTSISPTHIQIPPNGGVLVIWNQWQARTESPREGGPLYLGPLPNQCSLGPCSAAYPKHCCIAHITSVCFCVLSLKIACLWAESAPNFNICFEPTSAHSSCRQSCFAWNLVKSEQARRKCFSPPTMLA